MDENELTDEQKRTLHVFHDAGVTQREYRLSNLLYALNPSKSPVFAGLARGRRLDPDLIEPTGERGVARDGADQGGISPSEPLHGERRTESG